MKSAHDALEIKCAEQAKLLQAGSQEHARQLSQTSTLSNELKAKGVQSSTAMKQAAEAQSQLVTANQNAIGQAKLLQEMKAERDKAVREVQATQLKVQQLIQEKVQAGARGGDVEHAPFTVAFYCAAFPHWPSPSSPPLSTLIREAQAVAQASAQAKAAPKSAAPSTAEKVCSQEHAHSACRV